MKSIANYQISSVSFPVTRKSLFIPFIFIITIFIYSCNSSRKTQLQNIGWGDTGEGNYINPILNSDYPDVDIEKFSDRFYMITSTMAYSPGMTILESFDLVNWEITGHVFNKIDWHPKYDWDQMNGYGRAVWAGDLAYNDGRWYCYFIDATLGLYVSSAVDIKGPWSSAKLMLSKSNWTDPAVYWDKEGKQAYLICNYGTQTSRDFDGDGNVDNEIRLFKMSWDGLSLMDEGKPVYYGNGAEAAKIYKINGLYYIFMAQWIEGDRKQIVLRGDNLYGPFEKKIIMERPINFDRSTSQGALIGLEDGSWWLTHQLVQHRASTRAGNAGNTTTNSFEGRSQWLVPVNWENGWPIPGSDPDGNGINNTIMKHTKPIQGFPQKLPLTSDEFSNLKLQPQWQWNHNPREDRWSLTERKGWLRLYSSKPVRSGGFWNAPNTISQRLMGTGKGKIITRLSLSGMTPGQFAGFCLHSGEYVLLGIKVSENNKKSLIFQQNEDTISGPVIKSAFIYFCSENDGKTTHLSYSLNGKEWIRFGPDFTLTFGRWRGARPGFFCWNYNTDEKSGYIDIDWFLYDFSE